MNIKFARILLPLLLLIFVASCKKENLENPTTDPTSKDLVADFDNSTIWEWNELFLVIDKDALGYRPLPGHQSKKWHSDGELPDSFD